MLVTIASEFGNNIAHGVSEPEPIAYSMAAIRLLHARSCQITQEIIWLLSGGFADAAMARWRTLREAMAVASLIGEHGEDLAERYFAHEVVETRRAALQYQKHCTKLGQEPCSDEEMQHLESQYAAALSRYGRNFKTQQGWAAEHLKKASPKIEDIFEAVELDHLVPTIAWQAIMFTQIQRACCSS